MRHFPRLPGLYLPFGVPGKHFAPEVRIFEKQTEPLLTAPTTVYPACSPGRRKGLTGILRRWVPAAAFAWRALALPAQQTLFDDARLSSVHITLPADSLHVLYDSILSDHYYLARFVFDDTERFDTVDSVGFRLRGNTSRYSEKKSFKVSFNTYVPGRRYQGVKKINLNGEHNDPTMVREKLYYELWKNTGQPERRTTFVKVYVNQVYYGLYTLLEEMDKDWLGRVFPDNDGNLYKCTYPADLAYHGPDQEAYKELENGTATGGRVYELQTNEEEDDYRRFVDVVTVLSRPAAGTFAADIAALFNVNGFLRALALDVATGNWDDYGYNRNNYYLYDNPADGKFHFITYDPDNTFGIDWFGIDWGTRDCRNWVNKKVYLPLAQKLLAVPEYNERYKRYLDTIAQSVIATETVFPRIDAMYGLIREAAVADTFRTLDYGFSVADFDNSFTQALGQHVKYGLKPFFETRRQSILAQLHPAGAGNGPGSHGKPAVFPNPAGATITVGVSDHAELPGELEVTDTFGRRFRIARVPGTAAVFRTEGLSPGLYILHLPLQEHPATVKFIKATP